MKTSPNFRSFTATQQTHLAKTKSAFPDQAVAGQTEFGWRLMDFGQEFSHVRIERIIGAKKRT